MTLTGLPNTYLLILRPYKFHSQKEVEKMRAQRINKSNRDVIENYIIKRYNKLSQQGDKKDFLSIINIWDVQFKLQKKFAISDNASQKITWNVLINHISG